MASSGKNERPSHLKSQTKLALDVPLPIIQNDRDCHEHTSEKELDYSAKGSIGSERESSLGAESLIHELLLCDTQTLAVTYEGGEFDIFWTNNDFLADLAVFFPRYAVSEPTELYFTKSTSEKDFPEEVSSDNVLSAVYHFTPHGFTFNRVVRIRLRYLIEENDENVKVMYNAEDRSNPNWKFLSQSGSGSDDPTFSVENGVCTISAKHFCSFVIVRNDRGDEIRGDLVTVTLDAKYNKRSKIMEVTLTFQSDDIIPKNQVLALDTFIVYRRGNCVEATLELLSDKWKYKCLDKPYQKLSTSKLLNISKITRPELFPKITWIAEYTGNENELLELVVHISQPLRPDLPLYLKKAVLLDEIVVCSGPYVTTDQIYLEESERKNSLQTVLHGNRFEHISGTGRQQNIDTSMLAHGGDVVEPRRCSVDSMLVIQVLPQGSTKF